MVSFMGHSTWTRASLICTVRAGGEIQGNLTSRPTSWVGVMTELLTRPEVSAMMAQVASRQAAMPAQTRWGSGMMVKCRVLKDC